MFTKTGFYHGDLHAGNMMVPNRTDLPKDTSNRRVGNQITMIDFGNATTLSTAEQKNIMQIIAGAAGNDPNLFLKGLSPLLSEQCKTAFKNHEAKIIEVVTEVLAKGTGFDAGKRMTAVFKILQANFGIDVPAVISNFQASQNRLGTTMETMLKTMTTAEMRRLDIILAQAESEGVDLPKISPNTPLAEVFAQKYTAAQNFLQSKIDDPQTTIDVRERLVHLQEDLANAEVQRPASIMQCMVKVIKQNIMHTISTLGSSSQSVYNHLKEDGLISDQNDQVQDPGSSPKERRFAQNIWA